MIKSGDTFLTQDGIRYTAGSVSSKGHEIINVGAYAHKNGTIVWSGDISEYEWDLRRKLAETQTSF